MEFIDGKEKEGWIANAIDRGRKKDWDEIQVHRVRSVVGKALQEEIQESR